MQLVQQTSDFANDLAARHNARFIRPSPLETTFGCGRVGYIYLAA